MDTSKKPQNRDLKATLKSYQAIDSILDADIPFEDKIRACGLYLQVEELSDEFAARIFEHAIQHIRSANGVKVPQATGVFLELIKRTKFRIRDSKELSLLILNNLDLLPDTAFVAIVIGRLQIESCNRAWVAKAAPNLVKPALIFELIKNAETISAKGFRDELIETIRTLVPSLLEALPPHCRMVIRANPFFYISLFDMAIGEGLTNLIEPIFSVLRKKDAPKDEDEIVKAIKWCVENENIKLVPWTQEVSCRLLVKGFDSWADEALSSVDVESIHLASIKLLLAIHELSSNRPGIYESVDKFSERTAELLGLGLSQFGEDEVSSINGSLYCNDLIKNVLKFPKDYIEKVEVLRLLNHYPQALPRGLS